MRVKELAAQPGGTDYAGALRALFGLGIDADVDDDGRARRGRHRRPRPRSGDRRDRRAVDRDAAARHPRAARWPAPSRRPSPTRSPPPPGAAVELVHITTEGDRSAAAIAAARRHRRLRDGAPRGAARPASVDLAVHSYKDLPTAPAAGLILAAVPPPRGPARRARRPRRPHPRRAARRARRSAPARPRRVAQLRALGLGLEIVPIRGNVDTRMGRVGVEVGDLDAVVLARAGLARLGRLDAITETLDPLQVLPGARAGRARRRVPHQRRPHPRAARPARGRRPPAPASPPSARTLAALEAGCSAPVAAYAEIAEGEDGPELFLRASVTAIDGSDGVRGSLTGPLADAAALGRAARRRPARPRRRPSSWRSAR